MVCLFSATLLALFSIFGLLYWRPGGIRYLQTCVLENSFGESPIFSGTLQLLNSIHVRKRDEALLRSVLVGPVWNGFLLSKVNCGGDDGGGHLFWDCSFPPLVEIREHPVFHDLMELDKFSWPRWLLWHGWLPLLSGMNHGSPWAEDPAEGAGNLLECALGACILATLWTGSCRWGLMLKVLLGVWLLSLMSGLMGAW